MMFAPHPQGLGLKPVCLLLAVIAFVAPAHTQNLNVTLLGTGNPRPSVQRFGPSILVEWETKAVV
jgi:hypothetical protein